MVQFLFDYVIHVAVVGVGLVGSHIRIPLVEGAGVVVHIHVHARGDEAEVAGEADDLVRTRTREGQLALGQA